MNRGRQHRPSSNRPPGPSPVPHQRVLLAAAWALAGATLGAATARLMLRIATSGSTVPGAQRPEDVVLAGLAWLAALLAGWLTLGSAPALVALLPGAAGRAAGVAAERLTPVAVRQVLTLVLGASVGSIALPPTLVSSASSTPTAVDAAGTVSGRPGAAPGTHGTASRPAAGVPADRAAAPLAAGLAASPGFTVSSPAAGPDASPGFVPTDRVTTAPLPGPGFRPSAPTPVADGQVGRLLSPSPRPSAAVHGLVTVHRGDTLWSVVQRHLGVDASDADVAREWPRWYAANRLVIGADPDLVVPGQQLRPPGADDAGDAARSRSTAARAQGVAR